MAGALRFVLGFYPKTKAIEANYQQLLSEFKKVNEIAHSDEFARFLYLQKYVSSAEYLDNKKSLQNITYKGSEEHLKEEEYLRLSKMADIKFYYKFLHSKELSDYSKTEKSAELVEFKSLKTFLDSEAYKTVFDYFQDKKRFEKTPEYKQLVEYKSIQENVAFKNYFKFVNSKFYGIYHAVHDAPELNRYRELEKYINSGEFQQLKNGKDFKGSEAFQKLQEYTNLKNSSNFKTYFKALNSPLFNDFKKIKNSAELNYFLDLQKIVESESFKNKKREIEGQRFENTEEFKKLQKFKELEKSVQLKSFFKTHHSKQMAHYKHLVGSSEIAHYEKLKEFVSSDDFKVKKEYLLDPKKWEKTEDFKLFQEFEKYQKSESIVWYMKTKDLPKFQFFQKWNLVFEDNFDKGKLDADKWITKYFWGEMLMGESYALPGEKHIFSDKNVEMNGSAVKLITRQNKVQGKEWNPMLGFYPKDFDYSSGLISTGKGHRQKYGKIEAKVKIPPTKGLIHAFWLSGNTILPQIDIFKYSNNKLYFNTFWSDSTGQNGPNKDMASISASTFTKDYFIYSLEWSPSKLVWKINDIVVKEQTVGVPEDELYIVLNSGKFDELSATLPSTLEIDWVRCYQARE